MAAGDYALGFECTSFMRSLRIYPRHAVQCGRVALHATITWTVALPPFSKAHKAAALLLWFRFAPPINKAAAAFIGTKQYTHSSTPAIRESVPPTPRVRITATLVLWRLMVLFCTFLALKATF